jgi:hypothetical protein
MNIYRLESNADEFAWLTPVDEEVNADLVRMKFDGGSKAKGWKEIQVRVIEEDSGAGRPLGDFPTLSGLPLVLSEKAKKCLEPLVLGKCEFLMLRSECGNLYLMNVTNVIDALDSKKSRVRKFKDHIMQVHEYAFRADKICDEETIFKIPQPLYGTYVTDHLIARLRECGLQGYVVKLVWSSV